MKKRDTLVIDDELRIIDSTDLGSILRLSPQTIRNRLAKDPTTLPPRFHFPGSKSSSRNVWRLSDVRSWLADAAKQRKAA
jgi:predicted DNA-binding transcriptional regulator AlpA